MSGGSEWTRGEWKWPQDEDTHLQSRVLLSACCPLPQQRIDGLSLYLGGQLCALEPVTESLNLRTLPIQPCSVFFKKMISFIYFSFETCSPGWPQTDCVAKFGLELLVQHPPLTDYWDHK